MYTSGLVLLNLVLLLDLTMLLVFHLTVLLIFHNLINFIFFNFFKNVHVFWYLSWDDLNRFLLFENFINILKRMITFSRNLFFKIVYHQVIWVWNFLFRFFFLCQYFKLSLCRFDHHILKNMIDDRVSNLFCLFLFLTPINQLTLQKTFLINQWFNAWIDFHNFASHTTWR